MEAEELFYLAIEICWWTCDQGRDDENLELIYKWERPVRDAKKVVERRRGYMARYDIRTSTWVCTWCSSQAPTVGRI